MTSSPAPLQPIESPAIPLDRKSGFVIYFTLPSPMGEGRGAGESYTVTAGCECPVEAHTLVLRPDRHDKTGELSVLLTCTKHGPYKSIAFVVNTTPRSARVRAIFAPVEERFRNDRRVQ